MGVAYDGAIHSQGRALIRVEVMNEGANRSDATASRLDEWTGFRSMDGCEDDGAREIC
jgi:hypothetical protein